MHNAEKFKKLIFKMLTDIEFYSNYPRDNLLEYYIQKRIAESLKNCQDELGSLRHVQLGEKDANKFKKIN